MRPTCNNGSPGIRIKFASCLQLNVQCTLFWWALSAFHSDPKYRLQFLKHHRIIIYRGNNSPVIVQLCLMGLQANLEFYRWWLLSMLEVVGCRLHLRPIQMDRE